MFIAMNRFRVKKGSEQAFEKVWLSRDSQLNKVPGFVEFHLLKGPEHEDFTLYASHTIWRNRSAPRVLGVIVCFEKRKERREAVDGAIFWHHRGRCNSADARVNVLRPRLKA